MKRLIIPNNIDKELSTLLTETKNLEKYLYIIHVLYNKHIFENVKEVSLSSNILNDVLRTAKESGNDFIKVLLDLGFIFKTRNYSAGNYCNHYALAERFILTPPRVYQLSDKFIIKNTSKQDLTHFEKLDAHVKQIYYNNFEIRIKDEVVDKRNIPAYLTNSDTANYYFFENRITKSDKNGRVFTPVTSIKSEIRQSFIHNSGSHLAEIDLSNCHFTMLAKWSSDLGYYDEAFYKDCKTNKFYDNVMAQCNKYIEEKEALINENAEYLEFFEIDHKNFRRFVTRSNFKKAIQMNFNNACLESRLDEQNIFRRALKALYPVLIDCHDTLLVEYDFLSNFLNILESNLFLNVFSKWCYNNNIFYTTCHDSIIVKVENLTQCLEYFNNYLETNNYPANLKVTYYENFKIKRPDKKLKKYFECYNIKNMVETVIEVKPKNKKEVILEAVREAKKELGDKSSIRKIMLTTGLKLNQVANALKLI